MGMVGETVRVEGGLVSSGEGGDVGDDDGDGNRWSGVGYGCAGDENKKKKRLINVTDQERKLYYFKYKGKKGKQVSV